MSLTCHEEIGRVGEDFTGVLRGRYEETASVEFKLIWVLPLFVG